MNEYVDILYAYISSESNYGDNAPKYQGNVLAMDWIETYMDILKIYHITGDKRVNKILAWYQQNVDKKYIEEPGDIVLVYNYIVEHHKLPDRNSDKEFNNYKNMFEWLKKNRHELIRMADQGNRYAQYIMIYFNNYIDAMSQKKSNNIKVKQNKYDLLFEQHLDEYYNYLKKYHKRPLDDERFTSGSYMFCWYNNNKKRINEYLANGDVRVKYIEINSCTTLLFSDKCVEMINYISKNLSVPLKHEKITFSNNSYMGLWLDKNRYILIKKFEEEKYSNALVKVIMEVNPEYFDSIARNWRLVERVSEIKDTYQFVKRK